MKQDLEKVSKLDIEHITYYPLYYYKESTLSKIGEARDNI
jgi:coproporphyrinogen III oxidase-like Fe-S oxidoreductase